MAFPDSLNEGRVCVGGSFLTEPADISSMSQAMHTEQQDTQVSRFKLSSLCVPSVRQECGEGRIPAPGPHRVFLGISEDEATLADL